MIYILERCTIISWQVGRQSLQAKERMCRVQEGGVAEVVSRRELRQRGWARSPGGLITQGPVGWGKV